MYLPNAAVNKEIRYNLISVLPYRCRNYTKENFYCVITYNSVCVCVGAFNTGLSLKKIIFLS